MRKKTVSKEEELPSFEEQLNNILENFDFEYVSDYMSWNKSRKDGNSYTSWKIYMPYVGTFKVPTCKELKEFAKKLLLEVIERYKKNGKWTYVATGPFKATCRYGILELECIIESWSVD